MSEGYLILFIITIVIAGSKGRSVILWAILALLLPVISFILILLVSPVYRSRGRW